MSFTQSIDPKHRLSIPSTDAASVTVSSLLCVLLKVSASSVPCISTLHSVRFSYSHLCFKENRFSFSSQRSSSALSNVLEKGNSLFFNPHWTCTHLTHAHSPPPHTGFLHPYHCSYSHVTSKFGIVMWPTRYITNVDCHKLSPISMVTSWGRSTNLCSSYSQTTATDRLNPFIPILFSNH